MTRNALRLPVLAALIVSIAACKPVEASSSLAVFEGVAARVRKDCDQAGAKPVMGITTMKMPGAVVVTLNNDLCNRGSGFALDSRAPFPNGLIVVANASDPNVSPEIRQSSEHYDQLRRDGYGVVHMDNVQSPEQAQERMQAWLKKSGYENGYPGTAHLILHDHGAKDGSLGSNRIPGDQMAVSIAKGLNTQDCRLGVSACYSGSVLDNLQRNGQMDQFTSAWSSSSNNETSRTYGNSFQTGEAAGRQHAQFLSDVANNRNLQQYDANRDGTILTSEMIGTMKTPGAREWEATTHWQHSQQQGWVPTQNPNPNTDSRTPVANHREKLPDGTYVDYKQYEYSQTPQVGNDGVMYMSPQQPAAQPAAQQPAAQQPAAQPSVQQQPVAQPGTP